MILGTFYERRYFNVKSVNTQNLIKEVFDKPSTFLFLFKDGC